MKGHIIRLAQYTEFGKTDTVVLALVLNGTEARRILEDIGEDGKYVASRNLTRALEAIELGPTYIEEYNKSQGD